MIEMIEIIVPTSLPYPSHIHGDIKMRCHSDAAKTNGAITPLKVTPSQSESLQKKCKVFIPTLT